MVALWSAAVVLLGLGAAYARPTLQYSIQDQHPPVARVNQTFSFTLLSTTFIDTGSNTTSQLRYTALDLPAWASFNPTTLTFGGTPPPGSEGAQFISVTVNTTTSARSASDGFELVIVDDPAPTVRLPVADQLLNSTTLPSGCVLHWNGAIRVPPGWSFSIGLAYNTFVDGNQQVYYAADQTGTTSLPSWLKFDSTTVTFDGVAPTTPGEYSITLFGSDRPGYGDVTQTFIIEVSAHAFDLVQPLPVANATVGGLVNYTIPVQDFIIDHIPSNSSNLTFILNTAGRPYLSFDAPTGTLSGNLPKGSPAAGTSFSLPLNVSSSYGDIISTNITVAVMAGLFTQSTLPSQTLVAGQAAIVQLGPYLASSGMSEQVSASFSPSAAGQWLSYDATAKALVGTVPSPLPSYDEVDVALSAYDQTTGVTDHAEIALALSPTPTSDGSASGSAAASLQSGGFAGMSDATKIGLAAGLGAAGLIALVLLICLCCCRRRREREGQVELELDEDATLNEYPLGGVPYGKEGEKAGDDRFVVLDNGKIARYVDKAEIGSPVPVTEAELKPKRMDLMRNMFNAARRSGSRRDTRAVTPEVVVSSSENPDSGADTFRSGTANGSGGETTELEASTWGSHSSSSLFYTDTDSSGQQRRPANGRQRVVSQPRQRRDFMPPDAAAHVAAANGLLSADEGSSSDQSPSPSRHRPPAQIRMVSDPHRLSSSGDESPQLDDSMHFPAQLIATSSVTHGSATKPKLIPFTSERSVIREASPPANAPGRLLSQPVLHGGRDDPITDDEAVEDAYDPRRQSTPYVPPRSAESTPAPIFYPSPSPVPASIDAFAPPLTPTRRPTRKRTMTGGSSGSAIIEPTYVVRRRSLRPC